MNWFKYRPFDPQIGRGWQVDRLSHEYVHNSPYAFSENKVTGHIELDGLEAVKASTNQKKQEEVGIFTQIFSQFIGQLATGFAAIGALSSGETLTGQNFNQNLQRGTQVFTDHALLVQGSFEIMNNAAASAGRSLVKNEALTAEGASKFLTAKGFANLAETGTINPNSIKFSQGSISGSFKNGGDIANLAAGLKDGTISPSSKNYGAPQLLDSFGAKLRWN